MWHLKAEDPSWREQSLLRRLADVRQQLAAQGESPIDDPVMLVGLRDDHPRWMEQAILRKLIEVRVEMAAAERLPSARSSAPADRVERDALVREAIQAAPAWVMTVESPRLTIIDANPTCERLFGRPIVGSTLPSLLPPDETTLSDRILEVFATGESSSIGELTISVIASEEPEQRHWSFFLFPAAHEEDARGRVLVVGVDVTVAPPMMLPATLVSNSGLDALEPDPAPLQEVLQHVPVALAVVDARSLEVLFECNLDRSLRARAFPVGRFPKTTPEGWSYPDGSPMRGEEWVVERCLRGETLHHEVARMSCRNGSHRVFQVSGGPILSAGGHITSAVVVWDEITLQVAAEGERVRLQAGNRMKQVLLQEVIEAMPVGVVVHSMDGTAPLANRIATGLLGADLAPPRPWLRLDGHPYSPEDLPLARAMRGELVKDERAQRLDLDGTWVPIRLGARPVRADAQAITHTVTTYQVDAAPVIVPALAGKTVLVVEDELDMRNLLRAVFQGSSARVITASDGADALHQLEGIEVDLIVSDLAMPERDGYDLIRQVRLGEGQRHRMPAMALTAQTRDEDRSRALEAGFDAHLAKPVEPAKLVALAASLLHAQSTESMSRH